jgi:hypothetical protein
MARTIQTKRKLLATYTVGGNLTLNTSTKIKELQDFQPFINVGNKSMLARVVCKVTATFSIPGSSPALPTLFFKYLLDKSMVGPGNYDVSKDRRGWHDSIWNYMQRGEIDGIRGADIAASTTSATRTWTQQIDFEEPVSSSPMARMYPVEVFRAPNAGLWLTLKSGITIKGVALTVTAATVKIYLDVFDVPASAVPIPIPVSEFALQTNTGDFAPSPGPGKYLRLVMSNSPVGGDNSDPTFGAGNTPPTPDDLSSYTHIDSFGYPANYVVLDEDVDVFMQRVMKDVTVERHSQLSSNAGNKSEFRLFDPQESFDGLTRAIPLVYPSKGTDITHVPAFEAPPQLKANGGVRTGLPAGFWFLCQKLDPRTDVMLNAFVGAMSSAGTGKSIIGRNAIVAPGYHGSSDYSRAPLIINAT